jgi:pimeloyl-ACP methyl ester carboxylesterase
MPPKKPNPPAPQKPSAPVEVVSPIWLLKAAGVVVLAAVVCGYLTLCLLFYQGQWQLILHPTRTTQPIAEISGLKAEPVHFDAAESGVPRLSGLWIPSPALTHYPNLTVLYLRGGDSSLAQSPADAKAITLLHDLGLNVFAFDYRGYGQSDPTHPNQARMTEDAAHALQYLNESRRISNGKIILYGSGVGASLAARLAATHGDLPALILNNPGPAPIATALADPRISSLPVHLLFHEDFSLAALTSLKTPKLLISYPAATTPADFRTASDPKTTVELPSEDAATLPASIARFLDQTPR